MKIVSQEPWNYTLYEINGSLVLSVLCGSVGLFELNIPLTESESDNVKSDTDALKSMVNEIRNKPDFYSARSIKIEKSLNP